MADHNNSSEERSAKAGEASGSSSSTSTSPHSSSSSSSQPKASSSSSTATTPPISTQFDSDYDDETDETSVQKWFDFLSSCARGIPPYDQTPERPPLTRELVRQVKGIVDSEEEIEVDKDEDETNGEEGEQDRDQDQANDEESSSRSTGTNPLDYVYKDLDDDLARQIRDFYCRSGYLPSPRTSEEDLREQILVEYDLHSDKQINNFQASIDLVSAFFPGTLCAFTLFRDRREHHYALSGPEEVKRAFKRAKFPTGQSLSGHFQRDQLFLADLQADWRFLHHPLRRLGIKSFFGRTVKLELDLDPVPGRRQDEERKINLGIGTLNVYFVEEKIEKPTEAQENVLRHVTGMLETQLRATWEAHRRSREANANTAISGFIDDALASHDPTRLASTEEKQRRASNYVHLDDLKEEKEATTNSNDPVGPLQEEPGKLEEMAGSACKRLAGVLRQIDGLCIVDLRSVQPVDRRKPEKYYVDTESPYPTNSLAHFRSTEDVVFPDFRHVDAARSISKYLETSSALPNFSFKSGESESGMERYLPKGTLAHIAMPFFVPDDPLFIIIVTSRRPHYHFDVRDENIVRTMGSVLRAQALQARMIAADATKTAFLSSISHELRTPMHGVLTGLQLVREAVRRQEWDQLASLLGVAESSGKTLQHLLNDVLDFGSIGKKDQKESRTAEVDLARSAEEMAMACSTRMTSEGVGVDLIVEYEKRNWKAMIDEAGYHRILINGLSNSIKFTKQGSIRVVLSMSDDLKKVTIRIIDTGIGIKAKFVPKIFEPFTKSDSFSPGAGLGLYITKGLVDRMNGTLALSPNPHGGTTFEVVLPIRLLDTNKQTEAREKVVKPIKGWLTQQDDAVPSTEMPDSSGDESRQQPQPQHSQQQHSQQQQQQNPESDLSYESDKVRVLVVDDNDISRKLLLMALRKSPTKVSTAQATNGEEAVDKFRDFRPDLVLTDVSMPIMDGLTAAGHMRRAENEFDTVDAKCRIFAITGLGSSDPRLQKEGEASLDGWLVKGEHGLDVIYKIVRETGEKRTEHRAAHRAGQGEKQGKKVVAGENDETAEHGEQNKPESDREE